MSKCAPTTQGVSSRYPSPSVRMKKLLNQKTKAYRIIRWATFLRRWRSRRERFPLRDRTMGEAWHSNFGFPTMTLWLDSRRLNECRSETDLRHKFQNHVPTFTWKENKFISWVCKIAKSVHIAEIVDFKYMHKLRAIIQSTYSAISRMYIYLPEKK